MNKYIPKVHFVYSWAFDKFQRSRFEVENKWYPPKDEVGFTVNHIEKIWGELNEGDKVIKGIIEILGISFDYDFEFYVYGKGRLGSTSTPLFLCLYPLGDKRLSDTEILETIVHELIHRFLSSPRKEERFSTKKYWEYVREEKYKILHPSTQTHIALYAVLEKLRPSIFTPEQIAEINLSLSRPIKEGYREAIDMAKENPDFFIKEFTDRVIKYKQPTS